MLIQHFGEIRSVQKGKEEWKKEEGAQSKKGKLDTDTNSTCRPRDMTQQLRARAALAENQGSSSQHPHSG